MLNIPSDPVWVDTDQELARLCGEWSSEAAIAVDTEFMRSQTFYPKTGLLQVGDGKGCYLIDPTAIEDFSAFTALMTNTQVTKVFHSCSEDLSVFSHLLNVMPTPLFDTQVAAAYAGYGFCVGYSNLLKMMLNVDVLKGETRSDWLQRPLSEAQLTYAALDVAYLLIIYGRLITELEEKQRLSWVLDDCSELVKSAQCEQAPQDYYRKLKVNWKLEPQALAVLQVLCNWREQQARKKDIPRNHFIRDNILSELAVKKPQTQSHLYGIGGLTSRVIKTHGETLLQLIAQVQAQDKVSYPPRIPSPLSPQQRNLLKALKFAVKNKAETLDIPAEMLLRKKDYESIIRSGAGSCAMFELPERLLGWRRSIIGEQLLQVANGFTL